MGKTKLESATKRKATETEAQAETAVPKQPTTNVAAPVETPEQELTRLRLDKERLELEDLRMRVENEKARRQAIIQAHEQQQRSLDEANERIKLSQESCKHRKGGKGLEGILNGNDANYSVIKHTYPAGNVEIICSRCGKEWRKPAASLRTENPVEYARLMHEYTEAINFPTDNEPSGTQLFLIENRRSSAQTAAQ